MLKILKSFDDASAGKKSAASSQDSNDMKKILESFHGVQTKTPIKESASVSVTADNADELATLIRMMGHGQEPMQSHSSDQEEPDMAQMRAMVSSPCGMEEEDDVEEDQWDNSPDAEYQDDNYMIHDLSGGINRKKKMYAKAQDGDNAMAVESIKEQLWAALNEKKMAKKKDAVTAEGERHGNSKMYDKCWDGYEKVPGKKRGEPGSCRKK